jgi:hypothetical protein
MVHCQAVADTYRWKFKGNPSAHSDSILGCFGDLVQVYVSWYYFTGGIDYTYKRTIDFLPGQAQGMQEGAMWALFHSRGHFLTAHWYDSYSVLEVVVCFDLDQYTSAMPLTQDTFVML